VRFKALLVLWCLLWMFALPAAALNAPSASSQPQFAPADQANPVPPGQRPSAEDRERARIEKDMAKKINEERQAHLKRDTEQLLKLANELKTYVDKSNENILSLDVIKKAEEIEKLAHSVKEKMKASY
jgi:hypothetical protein